MPEVAELERFARPRADGEQAPQSQLFAEVYVSVLEPVKEDGEEPDGRTVE